MTGGKLLHSFRLQFCTRCSAAINACRQRLARHDCLHFNSNMG